MISFLRGKVINKKDGFIVLDVHDVGYQVFVGDNFLNNIKIDKEIEVYIYHRVNESSNDLYGFYTSSELELFELLLTVSGVGPKSALGVLNIASVDDIRESVLQGDASLLTKVSGIGKKTAERIVLELRGKTEKIEGERELGASLAGDEIEALVSLGYSVFEARKALKKVDSSITDSGERVKEALKMVGK